MKQISKIKKAATFIQKKLEKDIDFLIILGSGLGDFANHLSNPLIISYQDIPYFPLKQIQGHSGELVLGTLYNKTVAIMKGRPHYYQGYSDEEMRFPIHLFARLGVKKVIITNACGGMNPDFIPGDIMLIEDHINMMGRNPLTGDNQDEIGLRFVDMTEPYKQDWIQLFSEIASHEKIQIKKGIYVSYFGPNYETKSEIKAYRQLGGDAVGMSTVPEVIVANHAGMNVLGISCITNMSTGISKTSLSHEEVLVVSKQALSKISILLLKFIESVN